MHIYAISPSAGYWVVTIYYFAFAKSRRDSEESFGIPSEKARGKEGKEEMGEYSFPSFPSLPSFSLAIHVINKVLDGEHQ